MPSRLQDGFNLRTSEEKDEIERSRLGGFDANSHFHEEATLTFESLKDLHDVSIHAPVRRGGRLS